jgi:ribonuclease HI
MSGTWLLYTDGASRGNPGLAGIGAVLYRQAGGRLEEVDSVSESIGHATNNVAEYKAMLAGLKMVASRDPELLIIRADSELLIKQLKGVYRVRNENLKPLYLEAKRLLGSVPSRLEHVPREMNVRADELANQALDRA